MTMNNTTLTHPAEVESAIVWSSEHVEPIEELLQRAELGSVRVRALAADIRRRVSDLGEVIETDEQVAAWESELAEVNSRKAELEALLASMTADTPPADAVAAEPDEDEGDSSALDLAMLVTKHAFDGRVRGWARMQGYEVAKQGRIATSVVRMWIAAHPEEARADDH